MRLLAFLLVPTLCAAQTLKILPPGSTLAYDLTQSNQKQIMFTCIAPDSLSAEDAQLQWYNRNDIQITATSGRVQVLTLDNSRLLMIAQAIDSDAGTYTCKGNINGVAAESSIKLELYKGITNTSPLKQYPVRGLDAKIMCNVSASITHSVRWFTGSLVPIKTGDRFLQMSDHLLVRNIQLNDSGAYVCQCFIPVLGVTEAYNISVTVTIPPKMQGPITQQPPTPKEGDDLQLICLAEGTPAPTYMYYKGDVLLTQEASTNGLYRLEKVTRDNEGIYRCIATNMGGEDRQDVEVNIRIPPKIEPINNVSMQANQKCELFCIAKGDPQPNLFWRRKDHSHYYSESPQDGETIYIEESSVVEEENVFTSITRTTLKLVIPSLKPEDSNEYVCKAQNEVGEEERTGRIDVQYAPNFSNQVDVGSAFYGWLGGFTNLTCIANGNPEPVIRWMYNNKDITAGSDYSIQPGENNNPTQAVSYLIPNVRPETVGAVFGMYTCRAINKFKAGGEDQNLEFRQATYPGMPKKVVIANAKATQFELSIETPEDNGGQPVLRYDILVYNPSDRTKDKLASADRRANDEVLTTAMVGGLDANTQYVIEVSAFSKVGKGPQNLIRGTTATVDKPEAVHITSEKVGAQPNTYTLTWDKPLDNGAEILSYTVEYTKADVMVKPSGEWHLMSAIESYNEKLTVEGASKTSVTLSTLDSNKYYHVRIVAINRIGQSAPTEFIFKTHGAGDGSSAEEEDYGDDYDADENNVEVTPSIQPGLDSKAIHDEKSDGETPNAGAQGGSGAPALGTGGILGIIIVLLIVLVIAVDGAFCVTKQCGVFWTIRQAIGSKDEGAATSSKSPEDGDEAATKLLGKEKEDSLKTENEVAKEAESAQEAEPEPKEKELEPEDKEEKPADLVKAEEPAEVKAKTPMEPEAEAPSAELAADDTPSVETQPASDEKLDTTADA